MKSQKYNGWTNYETWAMGLWIDNDENSYRHSRDLARECLSQGSGPKKREIVFRLADELKNQWDGEKPDLGASVWSDLLGAAFSEINWHEIAQHFLDDVS